MPCLEEALGGTDVVGKGLKGFGVGEQGVDGAIKLEFSQALKKVEAVGGEFPTEQKEVFSGFGLGTGLAVGVVDCSNAMEESRQGGVSRSELGYGGGGVPGERR